MSDWEKGVEELSRVIRDNAPFVDQPTPPTRSEPLGCGFFAPCEQDADHEGPHTAGMYPEWRVPTMEPMAFIHPAAPPPPAPPLDVERLQQCPSLMALLNRYGRFNDAWWDRLADEYARLSGDRE